MAKHLKTGKHGEKIADEFLEHKGYQILFKNWRYSYYEIDLIAWKKPVLHFIEIKTRSNLKFGYPEESVTNKKMKCIMNAADEFLQLNPQYKYVQYDILCITLNSGNLPQYCLIEDIYYYGNTLSD